MVKQILTAAGFIENQTFRETRFLKAPRGTYAVYLDSVKRRGADNLNLITEHDTTIELYEYAPDADAEERIEAQFDAIGQAYERSERYWIDEEQIYQRIYSFNYISKTGGKDYV